MLPMVLVYLPTKLGDDVRANVGFYIPAPWVAYGSGKSVVLCLQVSQAAADGVLTLFIGEVFVGVAIVLAFQENVTTGHVSRHIKTTFLSLDDVDFHMAILP